MLPSKIFVLLSALFALAVVNGSPADVRDPAVKSTRMLQGLQRHFVRPVVPVDFVPQEDHITGGRFRTRVDHFDPQNRDTFEFSYFSNDEFYQPGGPIFIFVGGNTALSTYYITHGLLYDTAARDHAWLFTNEHRYYGTSTPVSDYSTENLRFLKSEQALMDLIEWIDHLKNNVVRDPRAKVILVGVGYGGALATWARQRFPNIIDGAWGVGATVLASFDFQEYAADVGSLIRRFGGDDCHSLLWVAFRTAQYLIDAGHEETVTNLINTCEPIEPGNLLDQETLFFHLKLAVQEAIFATQDTAKIRTVCETMLNATEGTALDDFAGWLRGYYADLPCMPFDFDSNVVPGQVIAPGAPENAMFGIRQTHYQRCTEFGWFLTTDADDQPFGDRVTMHFFLEACRAVFGDWITDAVVYDGVRLTNLHYGGQDPRSTNVLFTNGQYDPNLFVSITSYTNPFSYAYVVPDEFLFSEIYSITEDDSPELIAIKTSIQQYITLWQGQGLTPV
ncbi:putative serine protease K12H4.7 [Anopheles ziemanni]|uniref:putative serine protease K12H4.7 n=1 Tax=Anopheles coustani TaxID=139045 RepID=UPI002658DDC5|nr:putative serine protease K12H4.7 [Anopheles coustani]XP_058168973.1 putative serine protease K12H4.7 [Anopheles ziemanni]